LVHTLNTGKRHINLDAIARRSVTRFRPIVITSLTTLVGLVPAAYGWGGEEPLVTAMVMAMVWGVVFGTLVSLLMLPCLFAVNQDLRLWLAVKFGSDTVAVSEKGMKRIG
jgi:multidrug efflux pump subunit AcrB